MANTNALTESCVFSILHVAIHDAVNAVEPRYEPYLPRTSLAPSASVDAAIAGAAHATLVAVLPASKVSFDAALEEMLRTVSDDSRKKAGLANGILADVEGSDGFVYKGKLYLCGSKDAGTSFITDLDSNIERVDSSWQKLSGS